MQSRKFTLFEKEVEIDQSLDLSHAGTIWDSALVLMHYFKKNFQQLKSNLLASEKIVLELGAGTGIVAICMSEFKCAKYIVTDLPENILLPQHNINKNGLQNSGYIALPLQWGDEYLQQTKQQIIEKYGIPDVLIGSDLIYDINITPLLFETLQYLLSLKPQAVAILAYTLHKPADADFLQTYSGKFNFQQIETEDMDQQYRSDDIFVLFVTLKL